MRNFIPQIITKLFRRIGGEPLPVPAAAPAESIEPEWKQRIRRIEELVEKHRERVAADRRGPTFEVLTEEMTEADRVH